MPLSKERKGEIALILEKDHFRRERLQLGDFRREIVQRAKNLGINVWELSMFYEELIRETVDEAFPKTSELPTEPPQTNFGGR